MLLLRLGFFFLFCGSNFRTMRVGWGQESSLCVTEKCLSLDCQAATQLGHVQNLERVTTASPRFR